MGRPAVARVLLQPVEPGNVLRIPHPFENAHILAAGKHIRPGHLRIQLHDRAHHELLLIHLHGPQHRGQRHDKVPPDQRLVGDLGDLFHGDLLCLRNIEPLFEQRFTLPPAAVVPEENMQGKVVPERRIDPVASKTAAQAVGTLMHGDHAPGHRPAAHAPSLPGDHGGDRTAGGDPHLSFQLSHGTHPFRGKSKRRPPKEDTLPPMANAVVRY